MDVLASIILVKLTTLRVSWILTKQNPPATVHLDLIKVCVYQWSVVLLTCNKAATIKAMYRLYCPHVYFCEIGMVPSGGAIFLCSSITGPKGTRCWQPMASSPWACLCNNSTPFVWQRGAGCLSFYATFSGIYLYNGFSLTLVFSKQIMHLHFRVLSKESYLLICMRVWIPFKYCLCHFSLCHCVWRVNKSNHASYWNQKSCLPQKGVLLPSYYFRGKRHTVYTNCIELWS